MDAIQKLQGAVESDVLAYHLLGISLAHDSAARHRHVGGSRLTKRREQARVRLATNLWTSRTGLTCQGPCPAQPSALKVGCIAQCVAARDVAMCLLVLLCLCHSHMHVLAHHTPYMRTPALRCMVHPYKHGVLLCRRNN